MRRMLCAALALMLLLTACVQTETPPAEFSGAASDADETAEPEYPLEEVPLVSGDDPAEAMGAVLTSQASFYDVDKDEATTLSNYLKRAEETRAALPSRRAGFLQAASAATAGCRPLSP